MLKDERRLPPLLPPLCRLTRVEEDKAIGTDEVDTATSCFAREEENELLPLRIVELIDQLLSLLDICASLQTEVAVPDGFKPRY